MIPPPAPDDEANPMTRTELAMLWDLLGTWLESHPDEYLEDAADSARDVRTVLDQELADRFGA